MKYETHHPKTMPKLPLSYLRTEDINCVSKTLYIFRTEQKLPDNSMAHSQILIHSQCVLSLRIPVILAGRGDSKTKVL